MFGFRIVTETDIAKLVKGVTDDAIRACVVVAKARGADVDTPFGAGRDAAADDISKLLD